jgi:hypothetical protein
MNDEQIVKRKRWRFIVESNTNEDEQVMEVRDGEIKVENSEKSANHKDLEKCLAVGERLSKRIKNIDRIIGNDNVKDKMNDSKEVRIMFFYLYVI